MGRKQAKGQNISALIDKSKLARKENFYLESIFLSHAIIEERLRSVLLKIKSDLGSRNKIPSCIKKLKSKIKTQEYLFHLYFDKTFLDKILDWKKSSRDRLMHELEKNFNIVSDIEKLKK